MAKENVDILPIVVDKKITGILTYQHIISIYKNGIDEHEKQQAHISLNRQRLKILVHGQKLVSIMKNKK
jgi:predicted transcriptional regulator